MQRQPSARHDRGDALPRVDMPVPQLKNAPVEARGDAMGDARVDLPCRSPRGAEQVSVLGTCFTKQTGDMVYTMAENSWLSQLWLDA